MNLIDLSNPPPRLHHANVSQVTFAYTERMHRHWSIVNETAFGISRPCDWKRKRPVQSGLSGADVLLSHSNHSALSFPPLPFSGAPFSSIWNVFSITDGDSVLCGFQGNCHAAVCARGWKSAIWILTLVRFLCTLIISTQYYSRGMCLKSHRFYGVFLLSLEWAGHCLHQVLFVHERN